MTHIDGNSHGIENNNKYNYNSQHNNDFGIDFDKILSEIAGDVDERIRKPSKNNENVDAANNIKKTKAVNLFYNTVVDGTIKGIEINEMISKERYQQLNIIASEHIKAGLPQDPERGLLDS